MDIPAVQARALYTQALVAVYKERTTPTSFLRSFFRVVEEGTKYLSIEVQRGTEKIAVDVERGTNGNRNSFSRSTEKVFAPPYYREFFDATDLDLYDRIMGSGSIDEVVLADFINAVADKLRLLQDKIERSYERQCAQVLETGIVTLEKGINIDFKRKPGSLLNKAATPWAGAFDPNTHLVEGATFLRNTGKSQGGIINVLSGGTAFSDYLNNQFVKARADIRNFHLDDIAMPQRNSVGASFQGEVGAGSYKFRFWTYPQVYDHPTTGVSTPYLNDKKVILLPETPNFVLGFAAVPQLIKPGVKSFKGAYVVGEYMDDKYHTHEFDIRSAGVAIPVAVDQIVTMTVVA